MNPSSAPGERFLVCLFSVDLGPQSADIILYSSASTLQNYLTFDNWYKQITIHYIQGT
jgi:hypothetical protein